jgi:hypothetical protein
MIAVTCNKYKALTAAGSDVIYFRKPRIRGVLDLSGEMPAEWTPGDN